MNLSEITPISPQKLYKITKERGFIFTSQLFSSLICLEKNVIRPKILEGTLDLPQIKNSSSICLSPKVLDLLTLFYPFLSHNSNYLYYIMILDSFTPDQFTNWYRFTLVHWKRLLSRLSKHKDSEHHSILSQRSFLYSWREINRTIEIDKLEEMICLSLIYFVNLSGLDGGGLDLTLSKQGIGESLASHEPGNKLCMLFLLNTVQQYIIPT